MSAEERQTNVELGLDQLVDLTILDDPALHEARLRIQDQLFNDYIRENATRFLGRDIGSILELGCGRAMRGLVLRQLYPGARLVCIDRDAEAIARARDVHKADLGDAELIVGNIESWLPEGPFDLIYASHVLIHSTNLNRVVQLAYNALHVGGYLWIKDLDLGSERSYNNEAYQDLLNMVSLDDTRADVTNTVPSLLQSVGFIDVFTTREEYPLGGQSTVGKVMLAIMVSRFHNWLVHSGFRRGEANAYCQDAIAQGLAETGTIATVNIIGRRP